MKRIVFTCTFLLALIVIGVSASSITQTYLPIIYKQAASTPTQEPPTPTATTFPSGVQVLPKSFVYESGDMIHVVGEVLNNTSDSLYGVIVYVTFFNADGIIIDSDHTVMTPFNLPQGERGCFNIVMTYPLNWSYYIFDPPIFEIGSSSPDLTFSDSNGWYTTNSGDYEIIGQVENNGVQISYNVSVGGTLYNAYDEPVGCNYFDIDNTYLDPGGTSTFDLFYDGLDRNYNDVTNYRLRVAGDLP